MALLKKKPCLIITIRIDIAECIFNEKNILRCHLLIVADEQVSEFLFLVV